MFGRKKLLDDDKAMTEFGDELGIPAKPAPRALGAAATPVRAAMPASAPRPLGDAPKATDAKAGGDASRGGSTTQKRDVETRKLIVGREISLSGEITACDRLVVEGSVEANLANCRDIDIAESGLFKGSASIDDAEVRGRFEGTLNVRRRLLIRASGKVTGNVRYGQIEIECGGQISGDVQAQPMADMGDAPSKAAETPRPTIVPLS
ncbi:MAG TPA: polymer-forming cytoskeletal protein [Stellaceae bacterium]|nr:polymer-forming cytoskeletal protein [Stellaceae bacterium]